MKHILLVSLLFLPYMQSTLCITNAEDSEQPPLLQPQPEYPPEAQHAQAMAVLMSIMKQYMTDKLVEKGFHPNSRQYHMYRQQIMHAQHPDTLDAIENNMQQEQQPRYYNTRPPRNVRRNK